MKITNRIYIRSLMNPEEQITEIRARIHEIAVNTVRAQVPLIEKARKAGLNIELPSAPELEDRMLLGALVALQVVAPEAGNRMARGGETQ